MSYRLIYEIDTENSSLRERIGLHFRRKYTINFGQIPNMGRSHRRIAANHLSFNLVIIVQKFDIPLLLIVDFRYVNISSYVLIIVSIIF